PADTKFGYSDEHGNCLSENQFFTAVGQGRAFDVEKHVKAHSATLVLKPASAATRLPDVTAIRPISHWARGDAWPPLALTTLDGRTIHPADLHGHRTLVSFFFATCAPCVADLPALDAYHARHRRQAVLAITFDSEDDARQFVAARPLSWPVAFHAQRFLDHIGVGVYPSFAVVDENGRLVKAASGDRLRRGHEVLTVEDIERWLAAP
ncbi:TlpA disulfide reductase family protein, partial [Dyella sp.]|uniref:TlpA family protein disulfide reductase n=1 Tax=Dyella sp. TaxID=1869338 RepID=UPI002ED540F8